MKAIKLGWIALALVLFSATAQAQIVEGSYLGIKPENRQVGLTFTYNSGSTEFVVTFMGTSSGKEIYRIEQISINIGYRNKRTGDGSGSGRGSGPVGVGGSGLAGGGAGPGSQNGSRGGGSIAGQVAGQIGQAAAYGLAEALFKGLIWSKRDQRDLDIALDQISRTRAKSAEINKRLGGVGRSAHEIFSESYHEMRLTLEAMSSNGGVPIPKDDYQIVTRAPELRQAVHEARVVLNSIYTREIARQNAREAGLAATVEADFAYAEGDIAAGDLAIKYAKILGDIALGWDPVTGLGRGLYEIANGVNPFTGGELDDADMAKAAVAVVISSFGLGVPQKAARLIRITSALAKNTRVAKAASDGVMKVFDFFKRAKGIQGIENGIENAAAHSSFVHNRYVRGLFKSAEKPWVADKKLGSMMDDLYRANPEALGNGSTMAAIVNERVTGLPTRGKFHFEKGQKYLEGLEGWLKRNPDASTHDRHMAEKLIQSLKDALYAPLQGLDEMTELWFMSSKEVA